MAAFEFPTIAAVDVIASRPKPADLRNIEHIATTEGISLEAVAYVVKITLSRATPVTSHGFELYLGEYRVRKYWAFPRGVYFKVFNPRFFAKHGGEQIRFGLAGRFEETGFRLPRLPDRPPVRRGQPKEAAAPGRLPSQEDVLAN
jgi:hypothetical protein